MDLSTAAAKCAASGRDDVVKLGRVGGQVAAATTDGAAVGPRSVRLEAESAVYGEELAGDEGGGGGEEEGGCCYVLCGSVALHGGLAGEALVGLLNFILHDHAGGDAVHADVGGPSLRHRLGEHVQGSLGGAVVGVSVPGVGAAE